MSRLDVYLTENAAAKSRERAKVIIKSGKVTVNGKVCTKPAFEVGDDDIVVSQPLTAACDLGLQAVVS